MPSGDLSGAARMLTKDQARRIAANIAKLPELKAKTVLASIDGKLAGPKRAQPSARPRSKRKGLRRLSKAVPES
jgi:hypothetical protein